MVRVLDSSGSVTPLKRRDYLVLLIASTIVALVIVALQPVPGYMDADYYYAGGTQLARGHGFTDPFLWNYLDHPEGLPHPSNSYWNPLASMIAAGGMILTGKVNFLSARLGFILMASLAPLAVAALAYRITRRRGLALLSGVLTIFSGYYLPFVVTTDNYSLYMLIGALYFLILDRLTALKSILLGLLAGLLNLARGDGLLWLPLTLLAVTVLALWQSPTNAFRARFRRSFLYGTLALLGYLLVMGAWFARNLSVFSSVLPPGSGSVLWMTSYSQLYSFTPEQFTFQSWLASGWQEVIKARAWAVGQNLGTAFFAQGMIFLFPLILIGAWKERHLFRIQLGAFGWLMILLAESLFFPFASVSGGIFHAGAVFQPLMFALAPLGLDVLITRLGRGKNLLRQISAPLHAALLIFVISLSVMLVKIRVIDSGWNEGEYLYQEADQFLVAQGAQPQDIVVTRNPPAYYVMTGRQAIAIPYGQTLLAASQKYGARYVILEGDGTPNPIIDLYDHPENYPEFTYLGAIGDNLILLIKPNP
jgi:hypothetical protein